jgi:hypothetical protein
MKAYKLLIIDTLSLVGYRAEPSKVSKSRRNMRTSQINIKGRDEENLISIFVHQQNNSARSCEPRNVFFTRRRTKRSKGCELFELEVRDG